MSKKPISNRLDSLFADLEREAGEYTAIAEKAVAGWTWECDAEGNYLHVSSEVEVFLGIPPGDFLGKPLSRFRLPSYSTAALKSVLNAGEFPAEIVLDFITGSDQLLSVCINILPPQTDSIDNENHHSLRGFAQVATGSPNQLRHSTDPKSTTGTLDSSPERDKQPARSSNRRRVRGYIAEDFGILEAQSVLSSAGKQSRQQSQMVVLDNQPENPSTIALSTKSVDDQANLLLEILDDNPQRQWTDDERLLIEQVADQLALALENARLFQETQEHAEELGALRNISLELVEEQRDLDLVLQILVQRSAELLDSDDAAIWLWRDELQELELVISLYEGTPFTTGQRIKPSVGVIGYAFTQRTTQVTDNFLDTGIFDRHNMDTPFNKAMAVPLNWQSQVIGVLFVSRFENSRNYNPNERHLAELLAGQGAAVIQNARLFDQIQSALGTLEVRAKELSVLNEMSRAFSANLDVATVIDNIYKYTTELMDTENFYVALYHPEEHRITFEHVIADGRLVTRDHPEWPYWSSPQPVGGLTGHVIQNKTHLLVEQNAQEYFKREGIPFVEVGAGGIQSWLGVPMIIGDRVIGVISIQSEAQPYLYNQRHASLLTAIGNQAAIAIENARLLEETQIRNQELATLNKIIGAASRSLNTSETLANILEQVLTTLNFEAGLISVVNPDTNRLSLVTHLNLPQPLLNQLSAQGLEGTLCELVYTRRMMVTVEDFQAGAPIDVSRLIEMGLRSYIGVPLEAKGKITGTVCVFGDKPHSLTPEIQSLMQAVGQQTGVAVENSTLFEQTQAALSDSESLYRASAMINAARSYQDILNAVCEHTILGNGDSNVTINLFNRHWTQTERPEWITVLTHRSPSPTGMIGARHEMDTITQLSEYLKPDEATVITDVENDPSIDNNVRSILLDRFQAKSTIYIPLLVAGQWVGYINGIYHTPFDFSDQDIRRALTLAGQAAAAIQNIRLLEESRRRADQLQTAAEIARDTSGTLALESLLDRAVDLIRERFRYYQTTIFLLDTKNENAVVSAASGAAGQEMKRRRHHLAVGSKSIIGYVTQHGKPLVVNDVTQSPIHYANPLLPDTRSELGIPLKIGQRVLGALDVQSTQINAFNQDDISVLQTLADQIAVAVDNARAYELSLQAVDEMRNADRLKSQFLANMSHELRTPLNSIIGFSRVILKGIDGPVTELQEQDLEAIHNSGQHLLHLINDILDLSKIEAGKMDLVMEDDVSLPTLIESVIPTVRGLVKDKPVELYQEIDENLPVIKADPTKIRQVLINLFSNAAKFTDVGSITIKAVTQRSPEDNTEIIVSVSDTGSGISKQDQKRLFLPFSQVDASPTRKTGGSGLGLSISRHYVEMHGGRIDLTSKVGKGSTFYFTLPVQPAAANRQDASTNIRTNAILAIDQEREVINLYQRYLQNHGFEIIPLTDPANAQKIAQEMQPLLITLDIVSTSGDGWELLKDLKTDPATRHIPVIVCSILDEREKGLNLGASEYLLKPILEDDLVQAVSNLVDYR